MWGCFAGDTASDLFRIQGTLNQHGYHSILQLYTIPSGLRLVGLSFVFQQDNEGKAVYKCSAYVGTPLKNNSPLFSQVGQLRTSSHLQLRPGQDNAKQCDTNNNTELHMELTNIQSITQKKSLYTVCANEIREVKSTNRP
jgi:hypothetical protein